MRTGNSPADQGRAHIRHTRALAELLQVAVRSDLNAVTIAVNWPDNMTPDTLHGLTALSGYHRVDAFVAAALTSRGVAPPEVIQTRIVQVAARQLQALSDISVLAKCLDSEAIAWALLKGPILATNVYTSPTQRPYGDIDVLIDPRELQRAVAVLREAGARTIDRNWELMVRDRRGQLHLRLPAGTLLDLHWSLLNAGQVRERFTVPTASVLGRIMTVNVGAKTSVPSLSQSDLLAHLALHGSLSGGHQLIWLVDIDRVVRAYDIDWDEFVSRVHQWHARAAVGAMLYRAHRCLATPIPEIVRKRLVSKPVRTFVTALDAASPVGSAHTEGSSALLFSSLRDTGATFAVPRLHRWATWQGVRKALRTWRTPTQAVETDLGRSSGEIGHYFAMVNNEISRHDAPAT